MLLLTSILLLITDNEVEFFEDEVFLSTLVLIHSAITCCMFITDPESTFMTVTVDQQMHQFSPTNHNRTFDLLDPLWCYETTRFTVIQLGSYIMP